MKKNYCFTTKEVLEILAKHIINEEKLKGFLVLKCG